MFTGIISSIGTVISSEDRDGGRELKVAADKDFFSETSLGDSVALNGVCLTVTYITPDTMTAFAQIETLSKTTLSRWEEGDKVNLEHPLRMNDRLGGHLVQGHVDGIAQIVTKEQLSDGSVLIAFSLPEDLHRFVIDKGSLALNGVSLTVAEKTPEGCKVALIPATLEKTTYSFLDEGDFVNVEIDPIARYIEQLLHKGSKES